VMNPRWSLFAISFTALYTLSTLAITLRLYSKYTNKKEGLTGPSSLLTDSHYYAYETR
jgi:hypothetical protein